MTSSLLGGIQTPPSPSSDDVIYEQPNKSIRSFQRLQDGMFFGLQSTTQAADRKHELDWISQAKCFCNFNNTFPRWAGAPYENRTSSSINEVPGSNASDAFLLQKVEISGKPLRGRAPALFECIFT